MAILTTDTLEQGRVKINEIIANAETSIATANTALSTANTALTNSQNTQTQLNQVVIEGDSSVEAAQARVAANGTTVYTTLKERLDQENTDLVESVNGKLSKYNLASSTSGQALVSNGDGTASFQTISSGGGNVIDIKSPPAPLVAAVGDGVTDDTAAIQAVLDYVQARGEGGGIFFPDGLYRITASLQIKSRSIKLYSSARRTGDVFDNIANGNGGGVIVPDATADPAILLDSEYENQGFAMEDIAIARNIGLSVARTGTAIEFRLKASNSNFRYDFYFNRISIVNMDKCFYENRDASATANVLGKFVCENSFLLWNNQIHEYTNDASWNVFIFRNNYASSNNLLPYVSGSFTYGTSSTLHLGGVIIDITNNILESNPNCIMIENYYVGTAFDPWNKTGINIDGNYFEGNWGLYLIRLSGCSGFYIGNGFHEDTPAPSTGLTFRVYLDNCKTGICHMAGVFQVGCIDIDNTLTIDADTQIDTEGDHTYYAVSDEKLIITSHPDIYDYKTSYDVVTAKAIFPKFGQAGCNIQTITSTSKDFTVTVPSSATSGNWLVLTIPIMFAEKASYPRFDLILDGADVGSGDSKRYDFLEGAFEANKWYIVTIARKLTGTRTTCTLKFYPYASSSGTKNSYYINPTAYTTSKMRKALPWFNLSSVKFNGSPASGTWVDGDVIRLAPPHIAGGYTEKICISGGTPGTWANRNMIQA